MQGRHIYHRELPMALLEDQADVAPLYYHLAQRYLNIFPGQFEMVSLPGAGQGEAVLEQISTDYYIGSFEYGGDYGELFVQFMKSHHARAIYESHRLGSRGGY